MEDDPGRFPLLTDALSYALAIHGRQTMKGSDVPYMAHLFGVTGVALLYGADEDEAVAALLHDAVEDADDPEASETLIRARFGARIAAIVADCTDARRHPKPPWRERKEEHLQKLHTSASPSALLVYGADKLQNLRAILNDYREIEEALWDRFNGGKCGTLWYYHACLKVFRDRGVNSTLVDEIERTLTEVERLASMATGET